MYTTTHPTKTIVVFGRVFEYQEHVSERRIFKFLDKIDFESEAETGCWRWIGTKDQKGYGVFYYAKGKYLRAHRAAWFMFNGPLSGDLHLHHRTEEPIRCIGPNCVNPAHLLPVEAREHVLEYTPNNITTIRNNSTTCPKGHDLTDPANVYLRKDNGSRRCRICFNEWQRNRHKVKTGIQEKPEPTECGKGHEFTAENTYYYMGARMCRRCHAEVTLRRYHEKRGRSGPCTQEQVSEQLSAALKSRWDKQRPVIDGVRHCVKGHAITGDNVYTYNRKGQPYDSCKTCYQASAQATYERRKQKYSTGEHS